MAIYLLCRADVPRFELPGVLAFEDIVVYVHPNAMSKHTCHGAIVARIIHELLQIAEGVRQRASGKAQDYVARVIVAGSKEVGLVL
jgi:hypothetical protein